MKHLDEPFASRAPNQGYQAPAPMMGGALSATPERPQFAQFEVGKNGLFVEPKPALSEDALPPMPSWDAAANKHVLEEEKNGVELGHLDPATGQSVPLMAGAGRPPMTGTPSPGREMTSPYGPQSGQGVGGNGYMGVAGDSYSPHASQNGFHGNGGYRGSPSPGPGMSRRRPGYGPPDTQNMNGQGGSGYGPSPPLDPYGNDEYVGTAMDGDGYGQPQRQPQRQYSNDERQFPPGPTRQYSESGRSVNPGRQYMDQSYDNFEPNGPSRGPSPGGPQQMASSRGINNSGFDFGSGGQQTYKRPSPPPQQASYNTSRSRDDYYGPSSPSPLYASRSPPPQEPNYPGYQSYTPSNQGSRPGGAPAALTQPQGWDPVRQ
ncbi:uncharacterized protein BP5553_04382 [Venustampulla echinocandica]|uniref:Uncharacterized protein n=1 Tax=Venustampulla echinocandica TaxID=2656787 RepID=A0A370TN56_9HELO|nr:uncharacterized protein BP5553_04382 [Venustampulla echinocandica]RDL36949.1 hypothetical protein BP5553_04382 [Venustampulla echinocandica]